MNGIRWQRYTGPYNETLGQFGKTHATEDDKKTMCGAVIARSSEANVEGEPLLSVDCKKCKVHLVSYAEAMRNFDLEME